ncbi:hypothetical protein Tco_0748196 [Tanacetum coccineum]|uniref:Uncharacterized protein n=1 Tax=Tanacetum coccineum TaxID=301880 RepID=A0ABQ4YXK0_9ASTR
MKATMAWRYRACDGFVERLLNAIYSSSKTNPNSRASASISFSLNHSEILGLLVIMELWFRWICFDYRVTLGFGSIVGGLDHVNPVIRLPIEHRISRGTRVGTMAGVDINTLTMEQCLALSQENQALGMVKPEIKGNVNFEIKSQFMRELREDTFFRNKNEDAHDHID